MSGSGNLLKLSFCCFPTEKSVGTAPHYVRCLFLPGCFKFSLPLCSLIAWSRHVLAVFLSFFLLEVIDVPGFVGYCFIFKFGNILVDNLQSSFLPYFLFHLILVVQITEVWLLGVVSWPLRPIFFFLSLFFFFSVL
jgi:hypothetical protein